MKPIRFVGLLIVLMFASATGVNAETPAPSLKTLVAVPDAEAQFLVLLNEERSAAGLRELVVYDDLLDDARLHTAKMIEAGRIFHSTDLTVIATGWQALGENVGFGPTVPKLHAAFMNSPSHRANIMGNYDRVGIAVEQTPEGILYVTVMFMRSLEPPPLPGQEPEPLSPAERSIELGLAGAIWSASQ